MKIREIEPELIDWIAYTQDKAKSYGLNFTEVVFEKVNYKEMNELASLGGFPQRYPHWRFGMEYDRISKSYTYGLSKIYEMVINTDPCYAYLLSSNSLVENKLVIAHVYGHADFFKNNHYFSKTNRKMLDEMANHSTLVRQCQEQHGVEAVEEFIDMCLSLENLIDLRSAGELPKTVDDSDKSPEQVQKIQAKNYLDKFINTPEFLQDQRDKIDENSKKADKIPYRPVRDVLGFLLLHAPLKNWQVKILEMIREEAYYFAPQGQTKIMNEGWASYWHSKMMTHDILDDSEIIDYACVHSGTVAPNPHGINPYRVGIELFRNIEERWNKGRFGKDWLDCEDSVKRNEWDLKLNKGREKIFEVRKTHNDLTFVDEFLTQEFCEEQGLFCSHYNESSKRWEIETREFQKIKNQFLTELTNFGSPLIEVVDSNFENRGALHLKHSFDGRTLRKDYAELTLKNLYGIWKKPVFIETTSEENKTYFWGFDGKEFVVRG
ncbi:MAG: SpoVR family protein [Bdellovibrionota bacterium]